MSSYLFSSNELDSAMDWVLDQVNENTAPSVIDSNIALNEFDRVTIQTKITTDINGSLFTIESAIEFVLQCHSIHEADMKKSNKGGLVSNCCYRYRQRVSNATSKTYHSPVTNREYVIRINKKGVVTIDIFNHFRQVFTFEDIDNQGVIKSRHPTINQNGKVINTVRYCKIVCII